MSTQLDTDTAKLLAAMAAALIVTLPHTANGDLAAEELRQRLDEFIENWPFTDVDLEGYE